MTSTTTPPINAQNFPYRRKWTKAQVDEILARKDRIADALTDAVGPVGQVMYVDAAHIHMLALHGALAGLDANPDLAYIVPVIHNRDGMPADFHEWVLKDEYKAPPQPDQTEAKAAAAADQIRRRLTPEVRAEVAKLMIAEYQKATTEKDET